MDRGAPMEEKMGDGDSDAGDPEGGDSATNHSHSHTFPPLTYSCPLKFLSMMRGAVLATLSLDLPCDLLCSVECTMNDVPAPKPGLCRAACCCLLSRPSATTVRMRLGLPPGNSHVTESQVTLVGPDKPFQIDQEHTCFQTRE